MERGDPSDALVLASLTAYGSRSNLLGHNAKACSFCGTSCSHRQRLDRRIARRKSAARLFAVSVPGSSSMFASQERALLPLQQLLVLTDTVCFIFLHCE